MFRFTHKRPVAIAGLVAGLLAVAASAQAGAAVAHPAERQAQALVAPRDVNTGQAIVVAHPAPVQLQDIDTEI